MVYDLHGRVSELLAKAIDQKALDQAMPKGELEAFRQFLRFYGFLNDKGEYDRARRSGFASSRAAMPTRRGSSPPLTLKQLLPNRAIGFPYFFQSINDMQADHAPAGRRDGCDRKGNPCPGRSPVRLNSPVMAIRRTGIGCGSNMARARK